MIDLVNMHETALVLSRIRDTSMDLIHDTTDDILIEIAHELARYPSPPPASTYRRTGRLGRAWTGSRPVWRQSGKSFSAFIENTTPYATYVQGSLQAAIHKGRWKTAKHVVARYEQTIIAALDAKIQGVW